MAKSGPLLVACNKNWLSQKEGLIPSFNNVAHKRLGYRVPSDSQKTTIDLPVVLSDEQLHLLANFM